MEGFLCAHFVDFVAARFLSLADGLPTPSCGQGACPGAAHLPAQAEALSRSTRVPAPVLLRTFGEALFDKLVRGFPAFFVRVESTLELVARFDRIAAEMQTIDATVRLPRLTLGRSDRDGGAEIVCESPHGLTDLGHGILCGSVAHFGEPFVVQPSERPAGSSYRAVFRLTPCGDVE